MPVTARVASRISTELKRYQGILSQAQQRDVSESDTCVIIADMLSDVFGYNKYQHVTTEFAIRGTYVDLAVVLDGSPRFLIEAKAIGIALKDAHVKQAIDYAANQGIEWVVLTNGAVWRTYKIHFAKPIDKTLLSEIDVLTANLRSNDVIECFGCLSKEGFSKGSMAELFEQKLITSKFALAAVLLTDNLIGSLRRELRRLSPGLKVDEDYLRNLLAQEVVKRDLIDSDEAKSAQAVVKRALRSIDRDKKKATGAATREASSVLEEAFQAPAPPDPPDTIDY